MLPDLTHDERRAMDTYEGAVVVCTEWVREHVRPGTDEWKSTRGMLDVFVRCGIQLREQLVAGTGYWSDTWTPTKRIQFIIHVLQKLLRSAWNAAPKRDRPTLWPYMKATRELGRAYGNNPYRLDPR